ncbi:MAG: helix-turn-helix domain-containing protein [Nitrospirae bacterium]|nr:helix-turn-helix domain-containing protein [Nitrospirota bacterium]
MPIEDYKKYFEALELSPDAQLSEVRNSYLNLKSLYSNDSIVTSAIAYELSEEKRHDILEQVEEAYTKLIDFFENKGSNPSGSKKPSFVVGEELKQYMSGMTSFSGESLREIREKLGVNLKDMAVFTKIRKQYFEDIEREKFSSLPAEVYLKGYIMEYARYLSLDPVKVANDYIGRYRAAMKAKGKQD